MCEFCDPETKIHAQKKSEHFASVLINLAVEYKNLARGKMNPHSDDAKTITELSREVMKELVEWI